MSKSPLSLNWTNILFFTITPVIAIAGTGYLIHWQGVPWKTWMLGIVYMILTGLTITAGYHRLFAHRSYKSTWPVKLFYLILGAGAFQGSALEWCSDHRNHHRYVAQDKDPYSVKKGFWHAHILWLFRSEAQNYNFNNIRDLETDPLISWQHKYYLWIAIFSGFILPVAISSLWKDAFGGLIIAAALRMTINHHATFAVNSVCHYFGKRTYSKNISARDNWLTSFITFGEGFHNFHHQFPFDYRNGVRLIHYDPTKWLIRLLSYFGLAKNLRQIDRARIIAYRAKKPC